MFVRFVFVFSFCACLFAKAEISWLGTIRGDSECKAELFLFVSDISTSGCVCERVCECVCVPRRSHSWKKNVLRRLFSFQRINEHKGAYTVKQSYPFLCMRV